MKQQKILVQLITSRKIIRPVVKKAHIICAFLILILSIVFIVWLCLTAKLNELSKLFIFLIYLLLFFEVYARFVLILIIKIYQRHAREDIRRRCICLPSCSEYSIISLRTIFPLVFALAKIIKRLVDTCKGEKYVLDYPIKRDEEIFFLSYIEQNKDSISADCELDYGSKN